MTRSPILFADKTIQGGVVFVRCHVFLKAVT